MLGVEHCLLAGNVIHVVGQFYDEYLLIFSEVSWLLLILYEDQVFAVQVP